MSTTTVRMKAAEIYKDWHVIDAAGRPLGRLAAEAAHLLRGKHKPTFEPHLDCGDFVIIVNASKVRVGGKKTEQKMYYRHSGFPGGLRARTFEQQMAFRPERIIEQAVWGMLPSGPLGKQMFKHLKVYRGENHPHQSQISGTERARAAREAGAAEAIAAAAARKPRRLRPLAVPVDATAAAAVPARRRHRTGGIPPTAAPAQAPDEETTMVNPEPGEVEPAVVTEPPSAAGAAPEPAAAAEAPEVETTMANPEPGEIEPETAESQDTTTDKEASQ